MVDLSSLLSKGKSKGRTFYWSIVIEPQWVQAAIWTIENNASQVIATSKPVPWSEDAELVDSIDTALSSAVQSLEDDDINDPSLTVFGLPYSWIGDGEIKDEYLAKIKGICKELSLDPKGFVVLPEAISHFVNADEGALFAGVVIGIREETLEVSLFDSGKLKGTEDVARSVSLVDDVVEGLARLKKEDPVPSRILIYNSKEGDLEDARQTLLSADWKEVKNIEFLHTPKIEIITPEKKMLAVSLAGGAEIADAKSVINLKESEKEDQSQNMQEENESEDTGFIVGGDIAEDPGSNSQMYSDNIAKVEDVEDDFDETEFAQRDNKENDKPTKNKIKLPKVPSLIAPIKSILANFKKAPSQRESSPAKRIIIIGLILLVLLIASGFLYWYFFPKAEVIVYVSPRKLEERLELSIDPNSSSANAEDLVIPGRNVEVAETGSKTRSTTGTRTVGERAKGTVEIRNGTSSSVRIPAGTTLVADGGLEFETTNSASVSAALSPSNPGSETVDVSAADIGSEYNVSGDTSFSVGNFPKAEVDAVAQGDFSGGSSEEVAAVSESDVESLGNELTKELEDNAIDELMAEVSEDEELIEESLSTEVSEANYSASAGEEASSLKLDLTISVKALVVPKETLREIARAALDEEIPDGYTLRDEQLEIDFNFQDEEDGVYTMETSIVANLLPEVDPDEITDKIRGKYIHVAQEYLNTIPGFARVEILMNPRLPGRLGNIPYVKKNITVEIAAER